ncbi:4-hydroxy-3-methylbut-2-enyl diphosphate reductase [Candidatus Izemoplasma sp. B36]|uniref:4-hydroxy-3-methylbut-2-enyl diphosphate reductase n=1 Tax=Candidatus Izemoplasma sp. B36 TaxID=3242468 RepID=UPI0035565365
MKVISITPRGYCKGVVKAINAVKNAHKDPNVLKPIYVLGYIVHNKFVISELEKLGIITLDDTTHTRLELVDSITTGTVVLSAHGTNPLVKEKLIQKNIPFIDATCEDVEKTFDLIKTYSKKGYFVFYIGKRNHPEANAAISLTKDIRLIENRKDIPLNIDKPIFVTNQTTFSFIEIESIIDEIISIYPNTFISEEICSATRLRQKAILDNNKNVDLCYIVGDSRSNNTKNLALISRNLTHTKTLLIESVNDINEIDLLNVSKVSVSSGASTPTYLTNEVINYLKNYN